MPPFGPISRRKLIRALKDIGFEGPYAGGNHSYMVRGDLVVTIPNPHKGDIGVGLLGNLLRQIGISREDWEKI
ncbi:MAG: type II toxin-antitoxin system HicA family toxin [Sumerlaeia bacterium]